MAPSRPVTLALVLVLCLPLAIAAPSRILAVFPTVSKSHFDVFQPLLLALAARGHEITVISSFPQAHSVGNYTDISLEEFKTVFLNSIAFNNLPHVPTTFYDSHMFLLSQIPGNAMVFSHPGVRRLLDTRDHFDLILAELWNTDLFLGFAHRFNAPVVAISSCDVMPWGNDRFGNPDNPAYISNIFYPKKGKLNFWERATNAIQLVISKFAYKYIYDTRAEVIATNAFNSTLPPLDDLAQKTSLLLVNTHHTLHGPRPLSPQIVQVGGIHVTEPKPLEKVRPLYTANYMFTLKHAAPRDRYLHLETSYGLTYSIMDIEEAANSNCA